MITEYQYINDGTQFTGVAYAVGTAGGLWTPAGIPSADTKLVQEYVLYEIGLEVQPTLANATASIADASWYWLHTEIGSLKWDGQVTGPASATSETTLTGGTTGHTATIRYLQDDGTDGTILLTAATGVFQNNEAITGNLVFDGVADGTLDQLQIPLKSTTATQFRWTWEDGIPFGYQDGTKTPPSIQLITTTMVGNGLAYIKYGKRRLRH